MLRIQDNTVRDGMQQRNINKNFRTKQQVFELIGESGIDSVEIGMCASNEDYVMLCEEAKREVSSKYPGGRKPTPMPFCNRKNNDKKTRCMKSSRD